MRPRRQRVAALLIAAYMASIGVAAGQDSALNERTFDAAWTIIRDSHWDPEFNGVDWEGVREELRPRAAAAESPAALRGVLNEMIGRLGQSHFAVWPSGTLESLGAREDNTGAGGGEPGFETVLLDNRFVVARVDPEGPAAEAGVQPGWVLERVEGVDVLDVELPELDSIDHHELVVEAQRGMDRRLSGVPGTRMSLAMRDGDDRSREVSVRLARPEGQMSRFGNLPPMFARLDSRLLRPDVDIEVGLIGFNIWLPHVAQPFDRAIDAMRDARGIILDLRGNPGGIGAMVMGIGGHFVDEQVSLGTMRTRSDELDFVTSPRRSNSSGERVEPFDGPLAILVDNTSASTSEVFAGGLQAIGRARVFGQRTMGAVLPSIIEELPNGDMLQHAFADFIVSESGVRLEGRGVIPDEEVEITRAELLAGRDPVLDAAIEWIVRGR